MFINIVLIVNTLLLIYIALRIKELWNEKRQREFLKELESGREEEKAMVRFYGSPDKLIRENPGYVVKKRIEILESLGSSQEDIGYFVDAFMKASVRGRKSMMSGILEYYGATKEDKKNILERWLRE